MENRHLTCVASLFRFLDFKKKLFQAPQVLLLCSVYFGFYELFRFLVDNDSELIEMQNIAIRDRSSFKTVLHLLTYLSRDNDENTIIDKIAIIDYIKGLKPRCHLISDFYGNTPILESNINWKLVQHLLELPESSVEVTNYMECSLLDKNKDNTELLNFLKKDHSKAYKRLYISFCVRSNKKPRQPTNVPMKKFKYEDQGNSETMREGNRETGMDVNSSVNEMEMEKIISHYFSQSDTSETHMSAEHLAANVRNTLISGQITDKFLTFLLTKILETEEYSFKHQHLCNVLNLIIEGVIPDTLQLSVSHQEVTRKITPPFIVAAIAGFSHIARLFTNSFNLDWLKTLESSNLVYLIIALETHMTDDFMNRLGKQLEEKKYRVSWDTVKISLKLGSLTLWQVHTHEKPVSRYMLKVALACLLENSIFKNDDVIERRKQLIDSILQTPTPKGPTQDMQEHLDLGRVHYRLVRYLFEKTSVALKSTDKHGKNILNYCLENIIHYSEYLGESVYDKSFHHHDQVVYLAKKVGVNSLANEQLKSILQGITKLVKVKTSALYTAGFRIDDSSTKVASKDGVLAESSVESMQIASETAPTTTDAKPESSQF